MKTAFHIALLAIAIIFSASGFANPVQTPISGKKSIEKHGYTITPLAEFSITARVLSRRKYKSDREADLSPIDLALGWDQMAIRSNTDKMKITQRNRFYYYRYFYDNMPAVSPREMPRQSANMHMIPANDKIKKALMKAKKGKMVDIKGYLVTAKARDGWSWTSSMTRNDTGHGACEVIYVQSVRVY